MAFLLQALKSGKYENIFTAEYGYVFVNEQVMDIFNMIVVQHNDFQQDLINGFEKNK